MSRFLSTIAICCLALAAVPAHAETTASETEKAPAATLFDLPVGTQLEYTTSGSLQVEGPQSINRSGEIKSVYTVLNVAGDIRTIFADSKNLTPDEQQAGNPVAGLAKFNFQLDGAGAIQSRVAGLAQEVFPGWGPKIDFYQFPEAGKGKIQPPAAPTPERLPVNVTVTEKDGLKTYDIQPGEPEKKDESMKPNVFRGKFVYSTKDHALKSAQWTAEYYVPTESGLTGTVRFMFDTKLDSLKVLAAADLEKIQKDVAAGVAATSKLESGQGAEEAATEYLKQFPEGTFAAILKEVVKSLTIARKMGENSKNAQEGKPAPSFTAKTIDGETVSLADLKGKIVLLDFWATWCGPCVAKVPELVKIYEEFKDKGFTIIGISADRDEKALRDFIKKKEMPWKQIFEPNMTEDTVLFKYGVGQFPTVMLIDREGTIRLVGGFTTDLESAIRDLLEDKK
ncbi:MAG: TlpA family protein disulfide reductase [Candidatus Sumerlaeaceae bacterium]|nr:TlpA family protein disulfide reductase [Candidatus Sumerlaeaceae bacterium]